MEHEYTTQLCWRGDTADYTTYDRTFRARIAGKPDLVGSADPAFRGDGAIHNPEDWFVSAIASCHMLSYLALCARDGIRVVSYVDGASGRLVADRFETVVLRPHVKIIGDLARAVALHERAHEVCFIAKSCRVEIRVEPTVELGAPTPVERRQDLGITVPDRPGALAELGETLARAGISVEGGGCFSGTAHFLVEHADRAAALLRTAGYDVRVSDVLETRLAQGEAGQLGRFARALAIGDVNIDCLYSDHDHRLVVCVPDLAAGQRAATTWRAIEPIAIAKTPADIAYVRANFVTLEELQREVPLETMRAWAGVHLPRASYAIEAGELRFARDWWQLHDDAGGVAGIREWFEQRAGAARWPAYAAGLYGACLHHVTPENIVAKERLVTQLEAALADPQPGDATWLTALRTGVTALDALVRPFAACDRERFGRPTSRDRLIEGATTRFLEVG